MALTAQMGHGTLASIDGIVTPYSGSGLGKTGLIIEREGMRGELSHDVDDTRIGPYDVAGTVNVEPSAVELKHYLDLAMGGVGVIAEEATEFVAILDKGGAVYTYAGCKISRLAISGAAGGTIKAALDIAGKTETEAGSLAVNETNLAPYILSDLTLSIAGSARKTEEFTLIIDNQIAPRHMFGSAAGGGLTADDLVQQDRIVTLSTIHDATAANIAALYDVLATIAGVAGSLVLNDSVTTTTVTFGKLQAPAEAWGPQGKGPVTFPLNMTARKDGAVKEIAVAQAAS
jgi:hypothetical protein